MEAFTIKAQQTARRNLAARIARLLDSLDAAGRAPTPWEQHYLSLAIDDLVGGRYRPGEESVLWAEVQAVFDNPVTPRPLGADARAATMAELRTGLEAAAN